MIHLEGPGPYGLVACKTSNDLCGVSEGEFRRAHDPCKRCLASLAKRDREFQRKARRGIQLARVSHANNWWLVARTTLSSAVGDAARAIAREEGRL